MSTVRFFNDENELRDRLVEWLKANEINIIKTGVHTKTFEIDVVAYAPVIISNKGIKRTGKYYVHAFETKLATTFRLMRDVIEQAITRLLAADYVFVVIPKEAEIWKDGKTKERVVLPNLARKIASGVYSKGLGILAIDVSGDVIVVRSAKKSGLVIKNLRDNVIKSLYDRDSIL